MLRVAAFALVLPVALFCSGCEPDGSAARKRESTDAGATRWVSVAEGQLKTRVYTSRGLQEQPVLVIMLHGDLPGPSYQYEFARTVVESPELNLENVVAVGLLRPGYTDKSGETSSGIMGYAVGDNYTGEVTNAVASPIE